MVFNSDYSINVGQGLLNDNALINQHVNGDQAMIVTNKTIATLYLTQLKQALKNKQCDIFLLGDGEQYKNQTSLNALFDRLLKKKHGRDTTLIALGGGVVGDLTGFAAATYHRGVNLVQLPTTLLAQVDAAIGGKTAINHALGKNMIGSFYQPSAVIIDTATLKTLPSREFNAGFAEVIKYALLQGGSFLNQVLYLDVQSKHFDLTIADIIKQCCQIKMCFVRQDERDKGVRALLNLGHTVGHALEACTNYQRYLHGEAVAIGLYCAALLSYQQYGLDRMWLSLIDRMLEKWHLPRRIPNDIDLKLLEQSMAYDKKVKYHKPRFIVIKKPGDCYVEDHTTIVDIQTMLHCAVEGETIL